MISYRVRDLTEGLQDDRVLEHDHRVPVWREDAVLKKIPEHAKNLHYEINL